MPHKGLLLIGLALGSACAGCHFVPKTGASPLQTIRVGQPEVFANADLQSQLDGLRQQLASVNAIDRSSIISALGTIQGASATQIGASFQALQRGLPQVTGTTKTNDSTATGADAGSKSGGDTSITTTGASLSPAAPASAMSSAPALPTVALGSIGVLEQQLQLSSQVLGYQLLLTGSDFARYTTHGSAKDKVVIGFPITLNPQTENHDQAAEVEITYYPPNSRQFKDPVEFASRKPTERKVHPVCDPGSFFDINAAMACLGQEASPTIVNILPTERSYNTVVLSSSSSTFGLGALIGTVSVGGSLGFGHQTQYLVAQQDTLALQKDGPQECPNKEPATNALPPEARRTKERGFACEPGSRGVSFVWQFRPVLGQHFVRAGLRRMYVQLAIPFARRPYPNYGGIVEIKTRWRPYDLKKGVLTDSPPGTNEHVETRAVFGHPFMSPLLTNVSVSDLGAGNLLVSLKGNYLISASVQIGSAALNSSSPGFVASYNELQFTATAQALAQTGATVIASGGVPTPIRAASVCKSLDEMGECYRTEKDAAAGRFQINRVDVTPVSDSSSLVRVELNGPLDIPDYTYHRYFRDGTGVVGVTEERKPDAEEIIVKANDFPNLNRLPVLVRVGGKTYGFSDQPFQAVENKRSGKAELTFIATNDSLNSAPVLSVQRLFGDPDSESVQLIPPGRLQLKPFNHDVVSETLTSTDPRKSFAAQANCVETEQVCEYLLTGVVVDGIKAHTVNAPCARGLWMSGSGELGSNVRKVRIPKCFKQLTLEFPISMSGLTSVKQLISLDITAPPVAAVAKSISKTIVQIPNAPNFTLSRSVQDVNENQGVVYITVGVQKLKDQSATLTVSNADIVSAVDGSGATLPVQTGNQITVTQETFVTFQLRNAAPSSVNVIAEGKSSQGSTGKVTFDGAFNITAHVTSANPPK